MNTPEDFFGTKIISFTPDQIARVRPPALSDVVTRVIKESRKESLQQFVDHRREESTRSLIQGYWERD